MRRCPRDNEHPYKIKDRIYIITPEYGSVATFARYIYLLFGVRM